MTHTQLIAAILAAYALGMAALFACTRNGRHLLHVIVLAAHYRWFAAYGKHGHEEDPPRVRDALRALAAAGYWHARYWACRPRLWWRLHRIRRAVRGCIATPLLADPETLPLRVADPEPEEVPALVVTPPLRGRAPETHPYPVRETSPQAALTLPDPRWIPQTPYVSYTPEYLP